MKRENIGLALAIQDKLQYCEMWIKFLDNPDKLEILIRNPEGPESHKLLSIKKNIDPVTSMPQVYSTKYTDDFLEWAKQYLISERLILLNDLEKL